MGRKAILPEWIEEDSALGELWNRLINSRRLHDKEETKLVETEGFGIHYKVSYEFCSRTSFTVRNNWKKVSIEILKDFSNEKIGKAVLYYYENRIMDTELDTYEETIYNILEEESNDTEYYSWIAEDIIDMVDCEDGSFIYLNEIALKEEYRGKGLLKIIAYDIFEQFPSEYMVCKIFPLQYEHENGENAEKRFGFKMPKQNGWEDDEAKLRKSYYKAGFLFSEDIPFYGERIRKKTKELGIKDDYCFYGHEHFNPLKALKTIKK